MALGSLESNKVWTMGQALLHILSIHAGMRLRQKARNTGQAAFPFLLALRHKGVYNSSLPGCVYLSVCWLNPLGKGIYDV